MVFLIHYIRRAGKIASLRRFDDSQIREAEKARLELELALNREGRLQNEEVVILEADNEAAIRKTHGRYFYTVKELIAASGLLD